MSWWCASMVAEELPRGLPHLPIEAVPRRMFIVNIAHMLIEMRERAAKAHLDLGGGDLVLPRRLRLGPWMAEVEQRAEGQRGAVRPAAREGARADRAAA